MYTKIQAAKIAMPAGVTMLIIPGSEVGALRKCLNGEKIGTIFPGYQI